MGSLFMLNVINYIASFQVNEINFEDMSNDEAVRVLRDVVQKPGPIKVFLLGGNLIKKSNKRKLTFFNYCFSTLNCRKEILVRCPKLSR